MPATLRALLVAVALLTSGALQVAAAVGEDACCAEEHEAPPTSDCPDGVACACCPSGGAVASAAPELRPAASPGVGLLAAARAPRLVASPRDIFHPPRA